MLDAILSQVWAQLSEGLVTRIVELITGLFSGVVG
jgi:hypothetical protein